MATRTPHGAARSRGQGSAVQLLTEHTDIPQARGILNDLIHDRNRQQLEYLLRGWAREQVERGVWDTSLESSRGLLHSWVAEDSMTKISTRFSYRAFHSLFFSWLLAGTPLLSLADDARRAVDALDVALGDAAIRDRITGVDSLRARTRYSDRWDVWMVEFFEGDHRLAFVTVSADGDILERGTESDEVDSNEERLEALRRELEIARQTGNQAEERELEELIERFSETEVPERGPLDMKAMLRSVRAIGSYGMNILRWPPPESRDAGELQIECWARQSWNVVGTCSLAEGRWVDGQVQNNVVKRYRIRWIENGQPSESSVELAATPKSLASSKLPIYRIDIPRDGLQRMLADVVADIEIDGTIGIGGESWPIEIRLRGASTRFATKKSYRVQFKQNSPFPRDVIYLKAEPMDHTMQQEKLSCDLFLANDAPCFDAEYVNLVLNGRYEGVYLDVEPVRTPFKRNPGFDPDGVLIRASTFGWWESDPIGKLRGKGDGLALLDSFLSQARVVRNIEFGDWLGAHMDWPKVRDYLALQTLCHRSEIEADDYFFYQDPARQRWSLIPWDHNNGNFAVQPYGNRVRNPTISVFPQTIQDIGWEPQHSYMLHSRIFNEPTLRREYLQRLRKLAQQWLIDGEINAFIEANFERIREDYPLDPYRTPFEGVDPFLVSPDELKRFSKRHGERLLEIIKEAQDWRKPFTIDCVTRTANSATLRILNLTDGALDLGEFGLAFKRGETTALRLQSFQNQPSLAPGGSRDFNWTGLPSHGGLGLALRRRSATPNGDDFERFPIDFFFLPQAP